MVETTLRLPWVIVSPNGVMHLGLHEDEISAWAVALGWPEEEEIERLKKEGWYAAQANITWRRPGLTGGG